MNISFFVGKKSDNIGGMETHAKYFADHFSKENGFLTVYRDEFMVEYSDGKTVQAETLKGAINILQDIDVDIMFFNDGYWIEEIAILKKHFPFSAFVFRSGGNEFMKAAVRNSDMCLKKRQMYWADVINNYVDVIIANSFFTVNRMMSIGIEEKKILLIRGGVPYDLCNSNKINRPANRAAFDEEYNTQGKYLLCVTARLEPFKGIEEMIKILSTMQNNNWHLVIVGDGTCAASVKECLRRNIDPERYTVLGKKDHEEALKIISIADCLINPSLIYNKKSGNEYYIHTETMGRSMLEAICQDVKIVASDAGGTAELFFENENIGYMFSNDNEFRAALQKVFNEKEQEDDRIQLRQDYSWAAIFDKYEKLFKLLSHSDEAEDPIVLENLDYAVCLDIDGTITHSFLSEDQNYTILADMIKWQDMEKRDRGLNIGIIINTAGDYDEMLANYPPLKENIEKICIIANCGKKIVVRGRECEFWEIYAKSISGISDKCVRKIICKLKGSYVRISKIIYIDDLYINIKAEGMPDDLINSINKTIENLPVLLCANKNNIKIISSEINKASGLRFVLSHIWNAKKVIGAGNNILDCHFLDICDKAYMVNDKELNPKNKYINRRICSLNDANEFIKEIKVSVHN